MPCPSALSLPMFSALLAQVHKHGRCCNGALATVMEDVDNSIHQCHLPRPQIRYTVSHDSIVQKVNVPSGHSVIEILSIDSHADVRHEGLLHCSTTGRSTTTSLSCKLQNGRSACGQPLNSGASVCTYLTQIIRNSLYRVCSRPRTRIRRQVSHRV